MDEVRAASKDTGLRPAFLWNAAGVIWLIAGTMQIASYAFHLTPVQLPVISLFVSGIFAVVLSAIWFVCARRGVPADNRYHLALGMGLVVIIAGTAVDPNNHSADIAYPMLPMVCALVLFPVRHALPYVAGAVFAAFGFVVTSDDPTRWPRAIVIAVVILAVAGLLIVGQLQLRRALMRNRELSEIDALTGVANVRRLTARVEEEIARERTTDVGNFALIALDLDDFKAVNDTLGHSTGDRVLMEVARAIERELEPSDLLARRGGDEFTVVALEHSERSLEDLCERLAAAIEETRRDLCPAIEPAASIGIARREAGETIELLMARADAALHEKKSASHRRRGGARSSGAVAAADETAQPRGSRLLQHRGDERVPVWSETYRIASWQLVAGSFAVIAAAVPLIGLSVMNAYSINDGVFGVCLVCGVLGALCLVEGRDIRSRAVLLLALTVAFGAAVALVLLSGDLRNATVELMIVPSIVAFYVAGWRGGLIFAVPGMAIYADVVTRLGDDLAVIRSAQVGVIVLVVGYLVPRVTAQAREATEENERLSGIDPLTGLANIRRMNIRLADELDRIRSVGGYVTVFMIDLDDFKQVNDSYSHATGDKVLINVGSAITRHVRNYDLVARRGGDEFVAIAQHDGDLNLDEIAARIASEIATTRAAICPDIDPQASIGWVTSRPGDTPAELIARADASEKAVKQSHRLAPGDTAAQKIA